MQVAHGTFVAASIQRMQDKLAPIGKDGKSVVIHHMDQTNSGPVQEMLDSVHRENFASLHSNTGQQLSQINRNTFKTWEKTYWVWRSDNVPYTINVPNNVGTIGGVVPGAFTGIDGVDLLDELQED